MAFYLFGYDKYDNLALFNIGVPNIPFDIAENANEMPNSMKCVIENEYDHAYEPNTLVREYESGLFFVIKGDTCEFIAIDSDETTEIYKHTLDLGDALEYFNFVRVPPCVFPKNRYTYEEAFDRLFHISNIDASIVWASFPFINKDKLTNFVAFDNNFQLSTAIKTLSNSMNVMPYLYYSGGIKIGFKPKYKSTAPLGDIDTIFPDKHRKEMSNREQYMTRTYSQLKNVLNSIDVLYPNTFGIHAVDNTSLAFDGDKSLIPLPSKINSVSFIQLITPCKIVRMTKTSGGVYGGEVVGGFETHSNLTQAEWIAFAKTNIGSFSTITTDDIDAATFPDEYGVGKITNDNDWVDGGFNLLSKKEYSALEVSNALSHDQEHTFTWENKGTSITIPKDFAFPSSYTTFTDYEIISKVIEPTTDSEVLIIRIFNALPLRTFFRVWYRPIYDIVLSYDNVSEAQDEKPYNQSGNLLDAELTSKLVNAYSQESIGISLTRYKEFSTFASIYDVGDCVLVDGVSYVISQRSIDCYKDKFLCVFNLSKNKIARDDNIGANTDIMDKTIPDDNLVDRTQIYKDYLEITAVSGATDERHHDTAHYESLGYKLLDLNRIESDYTAIGVPFNLEFVAATYDDDDALIERIYVPTTKSVLTKSIVYRADFDDNYIIGIQHSGTNVQTPIRYADANANFMHIDAYFITSDQFKSAMSYSDYVNLPVISEADLTTISIDNTTYAINIEDSIYDKSEYETPIFQYHVEVNGASNEIASVIVADDILTEQGRHWLSPFDDVVHYYYVISAIAITQENAQERWETLFIGTSKTTTQNVVVVVEDESYIIDYLFALYSSYPSTFNATSLTNKCIGIYSASSPATMASPKFLFSLNFYQGSSNSLIKINVNNWKI